MNCAAGTRQLFVIFPHVPEMSLCALGQVQSPPVQLFAATRDFNKLFHAYNTHAANGIIAIVKSRLFSKTYVLSIRLGHVGARHVTNTRVTRLTKS